MLEAAPGALDLARLGGSPQLPRQFVALRKAGGAERMTFRKQAAGRVGDDLAAIGVVAGVDERLGAALGAQAQRLVSDQFVVGEAVMQFDDADIFRADTGLLVDLVRSGAGHVVADQPHHVLRVEGAVRVGRHRLRGDGDVAC